MSDASDLERKERATTSEGCSHETSCKSLKKKRSRSEGTDITSDTDSPDGSQDTSFASPKKKSDAESEADTTSDTDSPDSVKRCKRVHFETETSLSRMDSESPMTHKNVPKSCQTCLCQRMKTSKRVLEDLARKLKLFVWQLMHMTLKCHTTPKKACDFCAVEVFTQGSGSNVEKYTIGIGDDNRFVAVPDAVICHPNTDEDNICAVVEINLCDHGPRELPPGCVTVSSL
uniref:Uncharacterized protein n=1 Tax=Magallana gigas TaxID=29159 RepID=K1Q9K0_MAGGI